MELATQYQPLSMEFEFNSGRASPCGSNSPSTPRGFGGDYYFSAPTSPAPPSGIIHRGIESYYSYGANYARGLFDYSTIEYQGAQQLCKDDNTIGHAKPMSQGGKHKFETTKSPLLYPNSPKLLQHKKKNFWSSFSPKRKKETHNNDETTIMDNNRATRVGKQDRQRKPRRRQVSRSLSPSRKPLEEEAHNMTQVASTSKPPSTPSSSPSSSKGNRKWRFKDLLLFRSASEGRASDKDPLRKYSYMHWKHDQVSKNLSQSNEGTNIISTRKGPISAHEQHYTVNKAISEDMKKKSFLPYKQGILGHSAINPTIHALAHGFGSLANSHG